jgi:hypothetical protein
MVAAAIAVVVLAWLVSGGTAGAATPDKGTLSDPSKQVHWAGKHFENSLSPPVPELCGITDCDEFKLRLALPARTWRRPGGVQIGIKWYDPPEAQDLDLYVYGPDGRQVAKSDGIFASTAEAVTLKKPANGEYRVVVIPRDTTDRGLDYRGIAMVQRFPKARPVKRLLPDIVALPPRDPHFEIGAYLFHPAAQAPKDLEPALDQLQSTTNCYPEEIVELGAKRCLRFDQVVANYGKGPFELRLDMDQLLTDKQIRQRVYRTDGSFLDRKADTYEFHPAHAHFHYKNFAVSTLWAADGDGRKKGRRPVRTGKKNGFCMIDVENRWFGRQGDGSRNYYFPRCNLPTETDPNGHHIMVNGISPGWADVYNWYLADQFIDIAGVADGCYVLQTEGDPHNTIIESNERDNVASSLIKLTGDSAKLVPRSRAKRDC